MKRSPHFKNSGALTLYHGTLRSKLRKILKSGLKPSEGWGGAGTFGVFLSSTPDGAFYWAKMAYMLSREEKLEIARFDDKYGQQVDKLLAVVSVTVPASSLENLRADMEQAEDVGFEGEPEDWKASMKEIGDVMYDGPIPASWIRETVVPAQKKPGAR